MPWLANKVREMSFQTPRSTVGGLLDHLFCQNSLLKFQSLRIESYLKTFSNRFTSTYFPCWVVPQIILTGPVWMRRH